MMTKSRSKKPAVVKPVSGTCRWIIKPGHAAAAVLAINGVPYLVMECRDDVRTTGYRLQKEDGTVYDIDITGTVWECDCPDYIRRRAGTNLPCKHIASVRAALARLA